MKIYKLNELEEIQEELNSPKRINLLRAALEAFPAAALLAHGKEPDGGE